MSTARAKSYHSINIGDINTWDDWHLVPSSRPLVNPPSVKTHYVTVPGKNGAIDLTELAAGKAAFANRTGSWEFFVINSGQLISGSSYGAWYSRYTTLMNYLDGSEYDVILDDDPAFYYHGRLTLDSWRSNAGNSTIVINYNLEPYKWSVRDQNERWLWDPFNFETGVIRTYKNLSVKGTTTIKYILNMEASVHPVINSSVKGITVTYGGTTVTLKKGKQVVEQITISPGENNLVFNGTGKITIQATGGLL